MDLENLKEEIELLKKRVNVLENYEKKRKIKSMINIILSVGVIIFITGLFNFYFQNLKDIITQI